MPPKLLSPLLALVLPAVVQAATQATITKNILDHYEAAPHTFGEGFLERVHIPETSKDDEMFPAFQELFGSEEVARGKPPPPPPPPNGAFLSGVFSDSAVLQRAPAKAAVYGAAGSVFGNGTVAPDAGATVTVTVKESAGTGYTVTATAAADGGWKAMLKPASAGGDYTISAACTAGCTGKQPHTIVNVTFGDVWCAVLMTVDLAGMGGGRTHVYACVTSLWGREAVSTVL